MKNTKKLVEVWSFGGGTQSCAIAALVIQERLPRPDIIAIADTGRETKETWRYLDDVIRPALAKVGLTVYRIKAAEWGYSGIDLFNSAGSLLIPAFSTAGDGEAKLPAYCSSYWKRDVIDRWLSTVRGVKPSEKRTWIGYGREEQTRWTRMQRSDDYKEGRLFLPLVTTHPLNRYECQQVIKRMGWPVPAPRSRCFMCPNQSDSEWRSLSKVELEEAAKIEAEIQHRDPHAWLHKSCVPISKVDFSIPDDLFYRPCDSGNCFV
jgi:hypothetical protein